MRFHSNSQEALYLFCSETKRLMIKVETHVQHSSPLPASPPDTSSDPQGSSACSPVTTHTHSPFPCALLQTEVFEEY